MSRLPPPTQAPIPTNPELLITPADSRSPAEAGVSPVPSVASSTASTKSYSDDSSKLKTLLGILRKFVGVADIAAVRFSLPAQLLEPIPNLEYWHYLDRPDTFCSIGDSDDPLGRMLQCLRFWLLKDLRFLKGKPCKPYNSTLGEFFRCQWQVEDNHNALLGRDTKATHTTASTPGKVRVNYLTEQTSHHPPVSAYYIECPEKGISACGFDQISAKFTGTSIRVSPGSFNHGIYVTLHNCNNEEYHMTHPTAFLGGLLRGSPSISVADICVMECAQTGLKVLMQYMEEGWLGKAQNRLQGVIYRCDVATDKTSRIKDVSDKDIVGRIEGSYNDKVYFSPGSTSFDKSSDKDKILLADIGPMFPLPKIVPPIESQLPNESRRQWASVTEAILDRDFSRATAAKQDIEEGQRGKTAERKAQNQEWRPRFFENATDASGRPRLTVEGRTALDRVHNSDWRLEHGVQS